MSEYSLKLKSFGGKVKVDLYLSNYRKHATGVDTSKFTKNVDLANLKFEVNKLNTDKLEKVPTGLNSLKSKVGKLTIDKIVPVPIDLCKINDVVKNDVVKKDVYNAKVKDI